MDIFILTIISEVQLVIVIITAKLLLSTYYIKTVLNITYFIKLFI